MSVQKCCGFGIPDPNLSIPDSGTEIFHHGSRVKKIPDFESGFAVEEFFVFFTQKIVSMLSEI
jgi:hypothetical protein